MIPHFAALQYTEAEDQILEFMGRTDSSQYNNKSLTSELQSLFWKKIHFPNILLPTPPRALLF